MEDLKAYIESGILELYVLGDLSEDEKLEVERMLKNYPQLQSELQEIENALEGYAQENAVDAPESLRTKILSSMDTESDSQNQGSIIPINKAKGNNFYKYAFAASVALLLLSLVAVINMYSQLKESKNQIAFLQQRNQQFSQQVKYLDQKLDGANQSLEVFHSPERYHLVSLKGMPAAPEASMTVAFNPKDSVVMIDLASLKMPANDTNHHYQLWAMVNGKPVDLGVFDAKTDSAGMIKMKSIKAAQAFAVTLEPKGGSVNPTLDQLMLMGTI